MNKKWKLSYNTKRKLNGFVFVLPFLIGFIMFFAIPLINTVVYSFNKIEVAKGGGMTHTWAGLQNYVNLFTTEVTTNAGTMLELFTNQNVKLLISVPLITIFSLFMALLANKKLKGQALVRMIFFLPIILGLDVVTNMLATTSGTELIKSTNSLLSDSSATYLLIKYTNIPISMLNEITTYVDNIFNIISQAGVQTLLFLTALQSINPSLYEVAKIEGATSYETFWKVTIPTIIHIIFFVVVYTIVDLFLESEIAEEVYNFAFTQNKIGVGSALSVVYIINIIVVLGIVMLIIGKAVKKYGR
jgi:ABC-type sugar transport system permease subunit